MPPTRAYEMAGSLQHGVLKVTQWQPATTPAQKLREHLLKPGFGGDDYGLTDEQLARYLHDAEQRQGGRRLSVFVLAQEAIRRDHGARPRLSEREPGTPR